MPFFSSIVTEPRRRVFPPMVKGQTIGPEAKFGNAKKPGHRSDRAFPDCAFIRAVRSRGSWLGE